MELRKCAKSSIINGACNGVPQLTTRTGFIPELESLRFWAAFCVAYVHTWSVMCQGPNSAHIGSLTFLIFNQGYTLFNGQAAVDLFFLLSGFVLGRALDRHNAMSPRRWADFMWRRFWRILPTHWFTLIAATGYVALVIAPWSLMIPRPDHSAAMSLETFPEHITWELMFYHATLVMNWFNVQAWSLQVELVTAMLVPAMHDVARRNGWLVQLIVLGGFFAAAHLLEPRELSGLVFVRYLPAFYLGLMVQREGRMVAALLMRVFRSSDLAFVFCWWALMWPTRMFYLNDFLWNEVSMFGAFLLVSVMVWAPAGRITRFLLTPAMRHCGRLSFAFYLWHFMLLRASYRIICATVPMPFYQNHLGMFFVAVMVVTVLTALALGEVTHRLVELPGIEVGRWLAGAWRNMLARRQGAIANVGV